MSHDHEEHDHDHDHDHDHNMTNTTDPCAAEHLEDYDLPLHIAAIFIVFAASALGVLIPIILSRLKQRKIFTTVLVLGKCFGTGVILATALVHILPEAAETLHGECLPEWFHEYHGVSGLFCLIAVLVMHLIEWSVLVSTTPVEGKEVNEAEERDEHSHALLLTNQRQHNIATYSLELGIMVHSIIIGIALGLSTEEFHALFIAICFHQFFEGFALGALIAQVDYSHIVLAFTNGAAYAITTPVGVAIGIGIRDGATDPVASDIAIGIFESLAAGLLIYSVLVNLFAAFRQSEFLNLSKIEKFSGFLFFYLGAAVMATLGIWA